MTERRETPQDRYQRNKCTIISVKLINTSDADVIDKLNSVPNKSGYIKSLIRADIAKEQPNN